MFTTNYHVLSVALCLAHMSERHRGNLSKAAAKLMRTVDVDFNYTRPGTHNQVGRRRGRDFDESHPSYGVGISVVASASNQQAQLVDQLDGPVNSGTVDKIAPTMSSENFPCLGGGTTLGTSSGSKYIDY